MLMREGLLLNTLLRNVGTVVEPSFLLFAPKCNSGVDAQKGAKLYYFFLFCMVNILTMYKPHHLLPSGIY